MYSITSILVTFKVMGITLNNKVAKGIALAAPVMSRFKESSWDKDPELPVPDHEEEQVATGDLGPSQGAQGPSPRRSWHLLPVQRVVPNKSMIQTRGSLA